MIAKLIIVALALGSVSLATAERDLLPVESASKGQNFCMGCRSIVSFATFYNSTENRAQFRNLTGDFCRLQATGAHQDTYCNWFTEFVFGILNRVDPIRHCDQLGVCSPAGSGQPADCTNDLSCQRSANDIPALSLNDGVLCEVCEQAIQQVKLALTDPQVVSMIKSQAEQFCNYLAIIGEDKMCRHLVDNYMDQAIDFLKNVKPSLYCKTIALCSQNTQDIAPSSIPASVLASFKGFGIENKVFIDNKLVKDVASIQAPPRVIKGPNCMLCKTMVKEMFKFLKDNRTEENIRMNLDKVCSFIFSKNQAHLKNCEEMVQTYSKQIIEMLIDETDPDLICTLLEQCTYQTIKKTVAPEPEPKPEQAPVSMAQFVSILDPSIEVQSKRTCMECKVFIEYIQVAVADAKTEAEVRDWLDENLCNKLDVKSIKNTCTNLINSYSDVFFKAVIKELDPKTACQELKACSASRFHTFTIDNKPKSIINKLLVATNPHQQQPIAPVKRLGSFCDQCVDYVTQIDEYLSSHPLDHDVSVLIDQVCNKIPNEYAKTQCTFFIKTFGQEIEQAISTMDNPRQLCSKLMLCSQ